MTLKEEIKRYLEAEKREFDDIAVYHISHEFLKLLLEWNKESLSDKSQGEVKC